MPLKTLLGPLTEVNSGYGREGNAPTLGNALRYVGIRGMMFVIYPPLVHVEIQEERENVNKPLIKQVGQNVNNWSKDM